MDAKQPYETPRANVIGVISEDIFCQSPETAQSYKESYGDAYELDELD